MASVGNALVSLVPVGIGAVIAWNGWTGYTDEQELVGNAVETQAKITDIGATGQDQPRDGDDPGTSSTHAEYVPQIVFEYTVEGETYTATNVDPPAEGVGTTPRYSSESRARTHFEEYEEGETVTAYVDPARPDEGFLERETNTVRNLGYVVLGGALGLAGIAGVGYSLVVL